MPATGSLAPAAPGVSVTMPLTERCTFGSSMPRSFAFSVTTTASAPAWRSTSRVRARRVVAAGVRDEQDRLALQRPADEQRHRVRREGVVAVASRRLRAAFSLLSHVNSVCRLFTSVVRCLSRIAALARRRCRAPGPWPARGRPRRATRCDSEGCTCGLRWAYRPSHARKRSSSSATNVRAGEDIMTATVTVTSAAPASTIRSSGRTERAVQLAHALGVHELRADLEPHEERRRHALAPLVEVLDEVGVRADGDDEVGAALVRRAAARGPR